MDFKVGDVVVCVDAGTRPNNVPHPTGWRLRIGGCYRVSWVGEFTDSSPALEVEEDPAPCVDDAWEASRFRHLTKADDAFTEQMRSLKPKVTG